MRIPQTDNIPTGLSIPPHARAAAAGPAEPVLMKRMAIPPEALHLEEAVDKNVWVYRCCNIIARNIESTPLRAVRKQANGETVPDTSEAGKKLLALLRKPSPSSPLSGNDLIGALAFWMNVRQAFLWMQFPEGATAEKSGPPQNLYVLPANKVKGIPNSFGQLMAWKVTGTEIPPIPAWQVIRLGFFNPKDEHRGLSPTSVAFQAADTDYAAELHNARFFENGAKLSGFVSQKGEGGSERNAQVQAVLDALTGSGNAHAIGYIPSEVEFTSLMSEMKDMDFERLGAASRDKIAGAYGVPRFLLGIPDNSNRASAKEALSLFWENTLIPQMRDMEDKLSEQLASRFDPALRLEFDLAEVEALREDAQAFAQSMNQIASSFDKLLLRKVMTEKEARDILREKFGLKLDKANDNPEPASPAPVAPQNQPAAEEEPEAEPAPVN